jgi:hypothetical protein
MKKIVSIWIAVVFFISIALTSSFMAKYGATEPKDTPIEDILWVAWAMICIIGLVYYLVYKSLK